MAFTTVKIRNGNILTKNSKVIDCCCGGCSCPLAMINGGEYSYLFLGEKLTEGVLTDNYLVGSNTAVAGNESPWVVGFSESAGAPSSEGELSFGVACAYSINISFTVEHTSFMWAGAIDIYVDNLIIETIGITTGTVNYDVEISLNKCSIVTIHTSVAQGNDAAPITIEAYVTGVTPR